MKNKFTFLVLFLINLFIFYKVFGPSPYVFVFMIIQLIGILVNLFPNSLGINGSISIIRGVNLGGANSRRATLYNWLLWVIPTAIFWVLLI